MFTKHKKSGRRLYRSILAKATLPEALRRELTRKEQKQKNPMIRRDYISFKIYRGCHRG